VESSSPPWRVFDAPSGQTADEARGAAPDAARGGLTSQPLAFAALGAAVLIGGLAVVVALSGPVGAADGPPAGAVGSAAPGAEIGEVVVDVAGAVVTPGVYRLVTGARVGDAIDAAGGFSPRVNADRVASELNLAATLADGQQVHVPSRDDAASGGAGGAGGGPGSGAASGALIDLNSATQSELESLPGIGPVTATKIMEARSEAPFRAIDELRGRGLVGEKTFETIKGLITAG
jgi:competence protein ComEA